jgi:hypothetical protein
VLLLEDAPRTVCVGESGEDSGDVFKDDELAGKTFKPD